MNSKFTKQILADSLKQLSKTKSLSKITVQDIVNYCGMNRSTFYYHFIDKDDLIQWIFKTDVVDHFNEVKTIVWTNNTYHLLCVLQRDCSFYQQALHIDSQNNFRRSLFEVNYIAVQDYIDNSHQAPISEQAKDFIATFWASGFAETMIKYVQQGAKISPQKMLQYYFDLSEPGLMISFREFEKHNLDSGMNPRQE